MTFQEKTERLQNDLRALVLSGREARGEFLPSENQLAKQYGLSRPSVRKILDAFRTEGLIVTMPGKGTVAGEAVVNARVQLKVGCHSDAFNTHGLREIFDAFEKKNPFVRVDIEPVSSWFFTEALNNKRTANSPFDLLVMSEWQSEALAESGALVRLDNLGLDIDARPDTYYGEVDKFFRRDNVRHAVPFAFSPVVMFYNREVFEKAGVPFPEDEWTWKDFAAIAAKLEKWDAKRGIMERQGFFFDFHRNRWPNILLAFSDDDAFDSPDMIDGIRFCLDLLYKRHQPIGFSGLSHHHVMDFFRTGRVGLYMGSYFEFYGLKNTAMAYDIAPLPSAKRRVTTLLASVLGIPTASAQVELARQAIDFLSQSKSQELAVRGGAPIPIRRDAAESIRPRDFGLPDRYYLYRELLDIARPSVVPPRKPLSRVLEETMKMVWARLMTPEDAVQAIMEKTKTPPQDPNPKKEATPDA